MNKDDLLQQNRVLLKNFLVSKPIMNAHLLDSEDHNIFGYVYCIENKTNHKKYVGSTYSVWVGTANPDPVAQISKRASNYLYDYNKAKNSSTTAKKTYRPILQAMIDEGFDNFIMYPLASTNRTNHAKVEEMFIEHFDTIKNGYNIIHGGAGTARVGRKLMAKDKLIRSDGIICININAKKIIIADSMKLFGDYLSSSKDMIKNSNRKGRPYKGWFIFYLDNDKRSYILNKNVLGDGLPVGDRHSDKARAFYQELYNSVQSYLTSFCKNDNFPDFEVLPPLEYTDENI